jgi:transposase-like protein
MGKYNIQIKTELIKSSKPKDSTMYGDSVVSLIDLLRDNMLSPSYRIRLFFQYAPVPVLTELERHLRKYDTLSFTSLFDYIKEAEKDEDVMSDELSTAYGLNSFHKRMVELFRREMTEIHFLSHALACVLHLEEKEKEKRNE